MPDKWIIWSREHKGWWRPHRDGYTTNRAEAGQYSFSEAVQICRDANCWTTDAPEEAMVPWDERWSK